MTCTSNQKGQPNAQFPYSENDPLISPVLAVSNHHVSASLLNINRQPRVTINERKSSHMKQSPKETGKEGSRGMTRKTKRLCLKQMRTEKKIQNSSKKVYSDDSKKKKSYFKK